MITPTYKPNSLAVRAPELEKEWHQDNPKKFWEVSCGSNDKYDWACVVCQHAWSARPNDRTRAIRPSGCPECARKRSAKIKTGRRYKLPPRRIPFAKSLKALAPHLESEWSPKNQRRFEEVSRASNDLFEWVCSKGHAWEATPSNRAKTNRPTGCPECSGTRVSMVNSLLGRAPHLECEWHPDNTEKFCDVSFASSRIKRHWICSLGHDWWALPSDRTRKKKPAGCPDCSNHHSKAELAIFEAVKEKYPDVVSGQRGLLRPKQMELDIYIPSLRKAIEYDGTYWHSLPGGQEKDQRKNQQCVDIGIRLLRVPEADYQADPPGATAKALEWLREQS